MSLIFDKSVEGMGQFADVEDIKVSIPEKYLRKSIGLPQVDEQSLVRHYVGLSKLNYGVDTGIYPLGSCTMKYNPKINERVAGTPNFKNAHPYLSEEASQGSLKIIYDLQQMLKEITGMDDMSVLPAAGAHGEFVGVRMIMAYHEKKNNKKTKVIIPDTAHGTNPASCTSAGYKVVNVNTDGKGALTPEALEKVLDDDVAALMMTNPNTLGLFEENIGTIAKMLHEKDALLYCDGANLNALMGNARFGDMGVDVIHINLHKTFSTPHGGGGAGSGPVGVCEKLKEFFPNEQVVLNDDGKYAFEKTKDSIGFVKSFYGHFAMILRAYTYVRSLGAEGVKKVGDTALLNANYVRACLKDHYHIPFPDSCMHEVIISDKKQQEYGVSTLDIAKRLIDKGFHPPTIYFPLVVPGAMMVEPVETESKTEIDKLVNALIEIAEEAKTDPEMLHESPVNAPMRRMDEVQAARKPILTRKGE